MNTKSVLALCALGLMSSACQWVKPVDEARDVALVKPELAQDCTKISAVTVKVADSVGFINRRDSKVQEELIIMAKNEAAVVSGDIIVAEGEVVDGRQRFGIYSCGKP